MDFDLGALIGLATVIGSAGAAAGAAKMGINSLRKDVGHIDTSLVKHMRDDDAVQRTIIDKLARIETKLDYLQKFADRGVDG
jgi:hypothetical protein